MVIRKITAAAGFATGAALAFAPLASADTSSGWLSSMDGLLGGLSAPAASTLDYQISFNGVDLLPTTGNSATATTVAGEYGLAIASGQGATAIAEGGTGDYALASGTNALAEAGSLTATSGNNYDAAYDIGNNVDSYPNISPDGAFAGAGSLYGFADSATNSHDTAIDIGNNSGYSDGAFAGDGQLFGSGGAGNGDTAYTFGNITGNLDGSGALTGDNNYASMSGTETGNIDGAYSGTGNGNSAIADTNYSNNGAEVVAGDGNNNYAYVYGPDNSTATAGGSIDGPAGSNDIAYVNDPFSGASGAADSATAGSTSTAAGSNDLAEVLYTHGDASAQGANNLYDIITPFGETASPAAATGAADPAAVDPITSTLNSEVASLNSLFTLDTTLANVPAGDITTAADGFKIIEPADVTSLEANNTTFDDLLYGLNPANETLDPGAYDVLNGALGEFDNAYNVGLFSLLDPTGTFDPADIIGTHDFLGNGLTTAVGEYLQLGVSDLLGYFELPLFDLPLPS